MKEFKIYQPNQSKPGKTYLTSVYYDPSFSADEVKRSLINHDGFPSNIIVRKYTK